jgi:hypothetical protein
MTDTPESKPSGAFCVVIHKQLITSKCPLPKGSCYWKNRLHGQCTYSEEFANSDFTANEFAMRVGLPPIDSEVATILKNSLASKIRRELVEH